MQEQLSNESSEDEGPENIYMRFTEEQIRDGFALLMFALIGSDDAASWSPKDDLGPGTPLA